MGFSIESELVYGVYLDADQSLKFYRAVEAFLPTEEGAAFLRGLPLALDADTDISTLLCEGMCESEDDTLEVGMWADDIDMRCHDGTFEEGRQHGVGVKPLHWHGKTKAQEMEMIRQGALQAAKDIFEIRVRPLLVAAGLDNVAPALFTITQGG
jgi:hypothetical protein